MQVKSTHGLKYYVTLVRIMDIERKYRLLKVCYVPTTSVTFQLIFAAATNSTNETNQAGGTCH